MHQHVVPARSHFRSQHCCVAVVRCPPTLREARRVVIKLHFRACSIVRSRHPGSLIHHSALPALPTIFEGLHQTHSSGAFLRAHTPYLRGISQVISCLPTDRRPQVDDFPHRGENRRVDSGRFAIPVGRRTLRERHSGCEPMAPIPATLSPKPLNPLRILSPKPPDAQHIPLAPAAARPRASGAPAQAAGAGSQADRTRRRTRSSSPSFRGSVVVGLLSRRREGRGGYGRTGSTQRVGRERPSVTQHNVRISSFPEAEDGPEFSGTSDSRAQMSDSFLVASSVGGESQSVAVERNHIADMTCEPSADTEAERFLQDTFASYRELVLLPTHTVWCIGARHAQCIAQETKPQVRAGVDTGCLLGVCCTRRWSGTANLWALVEDFVARCFYSRS